MAALAIMQDLEASQRDRQIVPHFLDVQRGQAGMGRCYSTVGCMAGKAELGSSALEVIRIVIDQHMATPRVTVDRSRCANAE